MRQHYAVWESNGKQFLCVFNSKPIRDKKTENADFFRIGHDVVRRLYRKPRAWNWYCHDVFDYAEI